MIRKLLIANRGEIACRIIRTCREMGIATVAVYSDADADALHVEMADEAVHIGPSPASESYLNAENILRAALQTGADGIHPGYGFLSENPAFAQAVIDAAITWVGPPVSAMEAMSRKRESKLLLKGVPLLPGYEGADQSDTALIAAAHAIGYPVMIKASAGGGGKGMRRVDSEADMIEALAGARREASQAFGDDTLILEKYVINPRHIEMQILGDQHGRVIALGERECSIQRRHQKIIEETPSVALDDDLRQRMSETAVRIGQQIGYTSAGTVEFLLDSDKNFYFMEMNTRLQVEHPVTEMKLAIDLVRWQIALAEGRPLALFDEYFKEPNTRRGHSIEARIYAENPASGFLPATGTILHWGSAHGGNTHEVRMDTGVRAGSAISIHYDPMIAKAVAWGATRDEAIRRLDHLLATTICLGVQHNIAFLRRLIAHPDFAAGDLSTAFIDQHADLLEEPAAPPAAWIAAALAVETSRSGKHGANGRGGYWRNSPNRALTHRFASRDVIAEIRLTPTGAETYRVAISGPLETEFQRVRVLSQSAGQIILTIDGHRRTVIVASSGDQWWMHIDGSACMLAWVNPLPLPERAHDSQASLRAPMPGQVTSVRVVSGQKVARGEVLVTIEAMKMEHRIQAPYDGVVAAVRYRVGESVQADEVLLDVTPDEPGE
jgi:acetyl/propionyl-CoA carboxylase alpha subunit